MTPELKELIISAKDSALLISDLVKMTDKIVGKGPTNVPVLIRLTAAIAAMEKSL